MNDDDFTLSFTRDEIYQYLRKWGYEIRKKRVTQSQSVYHNDVEFWEEEIDVLYRDGKQVGKTGYIPDEEREPIHTFEIEMKRGLARLLT